MIKHQIVEIFSQHKKIEKKDLQRSLVDLYQLHERFYEDKKIVPGILIDYEFFENEKRKLEENQYEYLSLIKAFSIQFGFLKTEIMEFLLDEYSFIDFHLIQSE